MIKLSKSAQLVMVGVFQKALLGLGDVSHLLQELQFASFNGELQVTNPQIVKLSEAEIEQLGLEEVSEED